MSYWLLASATGIYIRQKKELPDSVERCWNKV
jgi:hypothetical protein